MTTYTTAELKEYVQEAIVKILTDGQAYSNQGRSWTKADLPELRNMLKDLELKEQRETAGGIRVRGATPVDS